jgi:aspartyl-tRNA(Asn)/glutamyl-tRNA(Gln) amidotransferase subunit B
LLESGGRVEQVTLLFNAATGTVRPTRSKEESHDYRYFPDPDLPPLVLDAAFIEEQRKALPELPDARRARFERDYGVSAYHAQELTGDRAVADYFEATVKAGAEPKAAAGWVLGDVMSGYNADGHFSVMPERLAELITLIRDGEVSQQAAKQVFAKLVLAAASAAPEFIGNSPTARAITASMGLMQVSEISALEGWVDEVLAANPGEVARFRGGEVKLIGFFVGQVMKKSGGKADPKGVTPILQKKLTG